jgi:hypothetical protein
MEYIDLSKIKWQCELTGILSYPFELKNVQRKKLRTPFSNPFVDISSSTKAIKLVVVNIMKLILIKSP